MGLSVSVAPLFGKSEYMGRFDVKIHAHTQSVRLTRCAQLIGSVAALFLLLSGLAACDGAGSSVEGGCEAFESCTTLSGISSVQDEPFAVGDAIVIDSTLYVSMTSLTMRFTSSTFSPDEIYVLSRPITGRETDPDQGWSMKQISDSPSVESGGSEGRTTMARTQSGGMRLLWGELAPIRSSRRSLTVDRILESTVQDGYWTQPVVAYEARPVPAKAISGAKLPAVMARNPQGVTYAAFREADEAGFGRVEIMKRESSGWTSPTTPFGIETSDPWLDSTHDGSLIATYIDLHEKDGDTGVMFSRSTDAGESWQPAAKITGLGITQSSTTAKVLAPKVTSTASPREVLVVYPYDISATGMDGDPLPDQIWYSVSTDAGATWTAPAPVNPSDRGYAGSPVLRRDDRGRVHLIYRQGPAFYGAPGERVRHAVWTGGSWQQQPDIGERPVSSDGGHGLAMAAGPEGCMHAVWDEYTDREAATSQFRYVRFGCPRSEVRDPG